MKEFLEKQGWKKRLTLQQTQFICQQLSFALAGGMPLPHALVLVGSEIHPPVCARFLSDIGQAVQQGKTMTQALQQSKIGFSPVLLEFILAGEQNGTMQKAMVQAADYFDQQNKTQQMLLSALFYPVFLLILMFAAFGAMLLFVVPTVVQTYENFDASLPAMTSGMLRITGGIQEHWGILVCLLLGGIVLLWIGWSRMKQIPLWRNRIKWMILHLPVAGKLFQQYWFAQIGQAMGLMLSSGMLLSQCVQALQEIYQRSLFLSELEELSQYLEHGYSLEMGMQTCTFIPSMARQMLAISEQTGALATAFVQLSQYYQQQVLQRLHRMIGFLEPCFVIVLGAGILLMAGSLFLPMVQSYQYLL